MLVTRKGFLTRDSRAGIPGVAGGLGVPEKSINFWNRVFFARKREKKIGCFFRLLGGGFVLFGGVFAFLGGVFVLLLDFFFSRASAVFCFVLGS